MRRVLIVCYDFPGIYGAGVIRTYQFAKKLPEFGWHPVILTAQECGNTCQDVHNIEVSDGELPCPKITAHTSSFPLPFQIGHYATRKSKNQILSESKGNTKRLARFAAQFAVPDGKIGWLYPAVKRGAQIAGDYPYQACFSVSPRPTAHFVAYRLARRLNLPWVADFALPWSDAYWLTGRPRAIDWLDQRLEGFVVRSAQQVTVAYDELARRICARYGSACADKISVIPTGFEEELFPMTRFSAAPKFTVVYPGNHFCEPGRDGEYFLRAIDEWLATEPSLEQKVEFVFIGKRDEDLLRHRAAMAYPKVIRVEPLVSHRACIQAIRSSHACVVNTVANRIPAKVYECMRAGNPILALTDRGSALERLIRGYAKGIVVPPRDAAAIRTVLERLQHNDDSAIGAAVSDDSLIPYSSGQSALALARVLDTVVSNGR